MKSQSLQTLNKVKDYYTSSLYEDVDDSREALNYLTKDRGFSLATLKEFGIGYAPHSPLPFTGKDAEYLQSTGHMLQDGVDQFNSRVVFPIFDTFGNALGFSGRIIRESPAMKYVNTSDTDVFQKKNSLFCFYQAREAIFKKDKVLLCEGYTDALAFHEAGMKSVVSCMGTYASESQLLMLSRYTKNLILAFDADGAGSQATKRTIQTAQNLGMSISVLKLPKGKDPFDLIREKKTDGT